MSKAKDETEQDVYENYRDIVLKEYREGKIVYMGWDGAQTCDLKSFLTQPADGILYDLNRDHATVLTMIKDQKWVNDYAVAMVITELKKQQAEMLDALIEVYSLVDRNGFYPIIDTIKNVIEKVTGKKIEEVIKDE